jgi:hypothetical protein
MAHLGERQDPGKPPHRGGMKRGLSFSFEEFGWESLEAQAKLEEETLEGLLARAFAYFASELGSGRSVLRAPRFKSSRRGVARELEVDLAAESWKRLEAAAAEQKIPLERLLEHAAFVYLADVESGRVADTAFRRAEESGGD